MTTADLRQQVSNQIAAIELKVDDLHKGAQLTSVNEMLAIYESKINGNPIKIRDLRDLGYVFEKTLEEKGEDLRNRWKAVSNQAVIKLRGEIPLLQREMLRVDGEIRQLSAIKGNFLAANTRLPIVQSTVDNFESKLKASVHALEAIYSGIRNDIDSYSHHLDEVAEMLRNIQTASFGLFPAESGIASVKAVWLRTGQEQKEDPEGILFLTDQRLIFEQREEVATKKVLFISTEKKLHQQMCFEIPLQCVSTINTRQTGIFKNEDVIDLSLSNAFSANASVHIWQDNEKWKSLINRAKLREFDLDRVKPIDETTINDLKNLPSQCPKCGVVWNKPLLRGQESYTCDYCGYIHRI